VSAVKQRYAVEVIDREALPAGSLERALNDSKHFSHGLEGIYFDYDQIVIVWRVGI